MPIKPENVTYRTKPLYEEHEIEAIRNIFDAAILAAEKRSEWPARPSLRGLRCPISRAAMTAAVDEYRALGWTITYVEAAIDSAIEYVETSWSTVSISHPDSLCRTLPAPSSVVPAPTRTDMNCNNDH